jgi:hypothetical protein
MRRLVLIVPDKITQLINTFGGYPRLTELEVNEANVKEMLRARTDYHLDLYFQGKVEVVSIEVDG